MLALKLLIVLFALFNTVPVADAVDKLTPFKKPAPVSETAPDVPVNTMLPLVLILPVLMVTLPLAAALISPNAVTLELIKISLAVLVLEVANETAPPVL